MAQSIADLPGNEALAESSAITERLDELFVTDAEAKSRLARIRSAIENYDPSAPEASHLRRHQGLAMEGFCREVGRYSLEQFEQGEGFGTLLPTGSGKTITMGEQMRMLNVPAEFKCLALVPRLSIQSQTAGSDQDTRGIQAFAPDLSIGSYGGGRRALGRNVVIMTYQSLEGALMRGDIAKFDPDGVFCDEMHHVIDGRWASIINIIRRGRLLMGQTATPAYSEDRTTANLFPHVTVRKTMRDGIEEGFLSDLAGYLYKGEAKIGGSRTGKDYSDQEIYKAIVDSPDNYLAAKICANEVENGGHGIVSCVPGNDRLHARVMAEILSHTEVKVGRTRRNIRAVSVDGEVVGRDLEKIMEAHERGDIDVLTFVDLLLEGWDAPWVDFGVAVRPSASLVLPEQRLGRIMRPGDGKVARYHEIIYEVEDAKSPQVTYLDILNEDTVVQGRSFATQIRSITAPSTVNKPAGKIGGDHYESRANIKLDPELLARISELDDRPLHEVKVLCGQVPIPYEWESSYRLAARFAVDDPDKVEEILEAEGIGSRAQEYMSSEHHYFPERANEVLIKALKIKPVSEGRVTLGAVVEHVRKQRGKTTISRAQLKKELAEDGFMPEPRVTEDRTVVLTYPLEAVGGDSDSQPVYVRVDPVKKRREAEAQEAAARKARGEVMTRANVIELSKWCAEVLVNPDAPSRGYSRGDILIAHSQFGAALDRNAQLLVGPDMKAAAKLAGKDLVISGQMKNVMNRQGLTVSQLLAVAVVARREYYRLKPKDEYSN